MEVRLCVLNLPHSFEKSGILIEKSNILIEKSGISIDPIVV